MNKFRYIFAPYRKGSKINCPSCGGYKSFRKYVDTETNMYLDESYGICDAVSSCGHKKDPYEFPPDEGYVSEKIEIPVDDGTYSTFNNEVVKKSLKFEDNLTKWLTTFTDKEELQRVLRKYYIGTSTALTGNSTVFWQISLKGEVRSGKIMLYNKDTGKRISNSEELQTMSWVHSFTKGFKLKQCLFGEHLLKSAKQVAVVESEKTAIIMSLVQPEITWLACGSMYGLGEDKIEVLKGRKVTFFPDKGGELPLKKNAFLRWKERIAEYENEDWRVSDYLEKQTEVKDGDDLADLVLQKLKK